jgi:hypothetical protein
LLLAVLAIACNRKVTRRECSEMLDRYLDMTIAQDPSLTNLSETESRAAREVKKAMRRAEPRYAKVEAQCEAEITSREYRCAMKAPNPDAWEACID